MTISLYLNPANWDLAIDYKGNIATASESYAVAQNVACAVKTFSGECWYNTTLGIPYFADLFDPKTLLSMIAAYLEDAANSVQSVKASKANIELHGRQLTGTICVTTKDGRNLNLEF